LSFNREQPGGALVSTIKQIIFRNSAYLLVSDVLVRLISTVATIALARYLGPQDYGIYGIAFALAGVFGFFPELGTGQTYLREVTRGQQNTSQLTAGFLKIRLCLAALATFLAVVTIPLIYSSELLGTVCMIVVIPTIWGSALFGFSGGYFTAIQEMAYVAGTRSVLSVTQAGFIFTAIALNSSLPVIAMAPGASICIAGAFGAVLVRRHFGRFAGWDRAILTGLTAFAIAGMLGMFAPQMGPLILEKVSSLEEVGHFAAVYRIPLLLMQIPLVVVSAYYPQLFKFAHTDPQAHFNLSLRELRMVSLISVGLTLPFALEAQWFVDLLFGSQWSGAGQVLSFLCWTVIVFALNMALANNLTTLGLQNQRVKVQLIAVSVGLLLYAVLGHYFGANGGAVAALTLEVVAFAGYAYFNPHKKKLLNQSINGFGQILLAGFCSTLSVLLLPDGFELLGVFIAPVIFYAGLSVCSKTFRSDIKWVLSGGFMQAEND